ncbi:AI-2E family transporter [Paenarthrobacter sp. Z7-10]|uniref:AI-2E family transporter n=1 Tax=Paenarthrobacter sp. Z7-10 TaxID=2787635 RepID=UPI0022A9F2E7|nr:AI-2E family transporter [Paenarthrobacter sp. Z7-10]MCZ2404419.1 AI-2E family transporter [Paenarthrobacter sp. Z7-10]
MRPSSERSNSASPGPAEDMPYAVRIAASWAWRTGVILLMGGTLIWLMAKISLLIIPVLVAALLAGLLYPIVAWLTRHRVPRGLSVAITELGMIAVVLGALALVGRQLVTGFSDLRDQALQGVHQVQGWLSSGPLHLSADQIDKYVQDGVNALQNNSSSILSGALTFGSTAGHFGVGLLLALFVLIFFLLEGERIWSFLVRLLPHVARRGADGAGRHGWGSMVSYVRIQLFVAFVDAVGIGGGAAILGVPLALPLGVLVLLGSFIPVVGALVTGSVAILLALVANGVVNALFMLGIVLLVQLLESHVLQPLVMGKAVSLHPVAVILAVAAGSFLAGIPGALFAVPMLAVTNTAVRYVSSRGWEHDPLLPDDAEPAPELDAGINGAPQRHVDPSIREIRLQIRSLRMQGLRRPRPRSGRSVRARGARQGTPGQGTPGQIASDRATRPGGSDPQSHPAERPRNEDEL